jgi:hypothetical protein
METQEIVVVVNEESSVCRFGFSNFQINLQIDFGLSYEEALKFLSSKLKLDKIASLKFKGKIGAVKLSITIASGNII